MDILNTISQVVKDIALSLVPLSTFLAIGLKSWADQKTELKKTKRNLQYTAYLNLLILINDYLNQQVQTSEEQQKACATYNEFILNCENVELIEKVNDLLNKVKNYPQDPNLEAETKYLQNLMRVELGLLPLDRNLKWNFFVLLKKIT